ncbi:hypothetical protein CHINAEXTREME_03630 [Halobiforma lacisalsi AJ5]|uniref:ChsH2 C-terminal OB-fold domain-containing protein n=2 Tax=Natronobacterium TaxID=2256 RepID=M0LQ98_NATLA|nr:MULTISPECIES: OB-fold domain-containing protein [Halobiforma]APW96914.1 hypothetical protein CHINAEXTREME_03630 [Halobiforma lacisalsi AJ5]EMA34624.1 hypothetical protein C445_06870 [Halobiforma lacisalsi AJ5]SFC28740.1 hypothetical protein SAMN05444422_106224 [Halobiforma haloterrestris]
MTTTNSNSRSKTATGTGNETQPPRDVSTDRAFACPACDHRWYYTRDRCSECGSERIDTYRLETGEVLATTTVHATPPNVRSPNRLGLVRFDGVSLVAQLEGDVSTGDDVRFGECTVLRGNGDGIPGRRLEPMEPADSAE